jgi:hypothetical protein
MASMITRLNAPRFFSLGACEKCHVCQIQLTSERNWLCKYTLLLNKLNTDLKRSTESDNHCYNGVMNVIRFRVDALNTFCKLPAKVLDNIYE